MHCVVVKYLRMTLTITNTYKTLQRNTLIRYLLNELYYYETDHSDSMGPISREADQSLAGEAALMRPISTEELHEVHVSITSDVQFLRAEMGSVTEAVLTLAKAILILTDHPGPNTSKDVSNGKSSSYLTLRSKARCMLISKCFRATSTADNQNSRTPHPTHCTRFLGSYLSTQPYLDISACGSTRTICELEEDQNCSPLHYKPWPAHFPSSHEDGTHTIYSCNPKS
jgi:hypothetical protein